MIKKIKRKMKKYNIVKRKRHIAKTFTWRIVGTIDTMLLGWLISGNPLIGLKIGLLELISKMVLYYFHERIWYKSKFGVSEKN